MKVKIITVEDARKKLGEKGRKMTDEEIGSLLSALRVMCNRAIDSVVGR
jgi:hypothetical protein